MHEYFKLYVENFGLREHIEFNTRVTEIVRNHNAGKWMLTLEVDSAKTTRHFDKVVISNGLVHTPRTPQLPGSESFEGMVIHGRDYKS